MIIKYDFKTLGLSISKLIMVAFLTSVDWLHCSNLDLGQAINVALICLLQQRTQAHGLGDPVGGSRACENGDSAVVAATLRGFVCKERL